MRKIRIRNNKPLAILSISIAAAATLFIFHASYASQSDADAIVSGYLKEASAYYKDGRYQEAISAWGRALLADPNNREAAHGIEEAESKISKLRNFFGGAFTEFALAGDFSIEDCIDVAAENNIQLETAKEQIKMANIKVWEARRSFLPELTLSWTKTTGIQSGGKVEGIEYGIEGKQPAFRSGGTMYALAQARTDLIIAETNYDKIRNDLYFEVAKAYYIFIKAKKQLEYAQRLYYEVMPIYDVIRKAYESAAAPAIEFLDAESSFNQLYYQMITYASESKLAKLSLEQKMGIEDAEDMSIILDNEPKKVTKNMQECLELALENRPDLKMSLYTVKYTEYGKKLADTKEMPSVDVVGTYKKSSEVYREGYGGNESQKLDPHKKWYIGLEANIPFLGNTASYSYFRRHDPPSLSTYQPDSEQMGSTWKFGILDNIKHFSEIEQAKIANIRAEQELDDARKKTIMEVKEAFYEYEKAHVQLKAALAQKEYREKEFAIFKFKKSVGEAEISDFFDAVTKLIDADALYCDAEANLNISTAALNRAIGIENYF